MLCVSLMGEGVDVGQDSELPSRAAGVTQTAACLSLVVFVSVSDLIQPVRMSPALPPMAIARERQQRSLQKCSCSLPHPRRNRANGTLKSRMVDHSYRTETTLLRTHEATRSTTSTTFTESVVTYTAPHEASNKRVSLKS